MIWSIVDVFKDEQRHWSAARIFLALWLLNAAAYVWQRPDDVGFGVALTFFSAVAVPLVVWAAGPRIAQYLGPTAGSVVQGVAESAKALTARVQARRNPDQGYEVSK